METINSIVTQKSALFTEMQRPEKHAGQGCRNEFLTSSTEFSTFVKTVRIIVCQNGPERLP
jgi:hypothetical protein